MYLFFFSISKTMCLYHAVNQPAIIPQKKGSQPNNPIYYYYDDNKKVILLHEDNFAGLVEVGRFSCVSLIYFTHNSAEFGRWITNAKILTVNLSSVLNWLLLIILFFFIFFLTIANLPACQTDDSLTSDHQEFSSKTVFLPLVIMKVPVN